MPIICAKCGGKKDRRAVHCRKCMEQPRPKEGVPRLLPKIGYMYVMIDGQKIYEHRYVIEKKIGRKLDRNEHVHHKNGIKTDNRIENLELMTAAEHQREHILPRAKDMSLLGHAARWGV